MEGFRQDIPLSYPSIAYLKKITISVKLKRDFGTER
jgi:hypothetical protein